MAKKLENDWDFYTEEELAQLELLQLSQPPGPELPSTDWLRRNARWTTDRLVDMGRAEQGT